jgi:hypothetical protein
MKNLLLGLIVICSFWGFSQEVLTPLSTNPSLYKDLHQVKAGNSIDSSFQYSYSNLDLIDVWDDFSVNKFEQYNSTYTDGNVTSVWYYHLMNATNTVPEPSSVAYCDSTQARHDSVTVVGGIGTTYSYYFTPTSIWVNDLNTYPVTGELKNMYTECYVLIDSLIDGVQKPTQDTVWYNNPPGFEQDSANVFLVDLNDNEKIWVDNQACHNYRYAVDPWSLGVATMDGVDSTGMPYDFGNTNAYGEADHLTSKPINLGGTSNVFLQFLYQAQGHGNMPEPEDSLVIDMFSVDSNRWFLDMWHAPSGWTANDWDTAFIIINPALLDNGFRFRFRNYASTSGALDHWHIDYVQLYENPLFAVQEFKDLAISYPVTTMLKDFTSVPWDHYLNLSGADRESKMIDTLFLDVYNSDGTATNVGTGMELDIAYDGSSFENDVLGNPAGPAPWTSNWELGMNYFPCVFPNHEFVAAGNDTMATFDIKVNVSADVAGSNVFDVNDTSFSQQVFKNYYSYDDGSAEVAYGIQGSNSQLAYEFDVYEADTLTGVLMHFVPTVTDVSGYIMLLTVWDDINGEPGNILYQDDYFTPHHPEYGWSKNDFAYYEFVNTDYPSQIAVPEKFYVGWEQVDSQSLNVGMDRNTDSGSKIRFNTSGSWSTSSQAGSLMIRPVFSTAIDYTLNDSEIDIATDITMYPNPANDVVYLDGLRGDCTIMLFDMSGRIVSAEENTNMLDLSFFENGIYIVDVKDENGVTVFSDKLIKE